MLIAVVTSGYNYSITVQIGRFQERKLFDDGMSEKPEMTIKMSVFLTELARE